MSLQSNAISASSCSARLAQLLRRAPPNPCPILPDWTTNAARVGDVGPNRMRHFASSSKAGLLVTDPLLAWGSTGTMGVRELLDAVDRAQAARTSANRALWERLSCRARVLAPELLASEIARLSFGFSRASVQDEELLDAFFEVLLDDPEHARVWENVSVNDAALLLKAFSKHGLVDDRVFELLLRFFVEHLEEATAADISQFLAAAVRLGKTEDAGWLEPSGQAGKSVLGLLLETASSRLDDAYLPASDITNLCIAAAKLPPIEDSAAFLLRVVRRLQWETSTATVAPSDIVRRLRGLGFFERREVTSRPEVGLSFEDRLQILKVAGGAVSRRCQELPPNMTAEALEAFLDLFKGSSSLELAASRGGVIDWSVLRPLLHLAIQRSGGLPGPARAKLHKVAVGLQKLSAPPPPPPPPHASPEVVGTESPEAGQNEEEQRTGTEPLLERLAALTAS